MIGGEDWSSEGEGLPGERSEADASRREREPSAPEPLHVGRAKLDGAHRALSFLAHPALSAPIVGDYQAYFESVAQAAVKTVCDGCMIDIVTPEGIRPYAAAHVQASREPELRDLARRDLSSILDAAVLRVPLTVHDGPLGVMTVWSEEGRSLEPAELTLLHWMARHLALLLDKRRLEKSAEESSRASDALLSMVSHELRTPLATISMGLDASMHRVQSSADELPKSWLLQRLAKMKKAVVRTDRLIHTFLGVSQIQTGRLVPDVQDVDAAALVARVVHMMSDDLTWAGCELELQAPLPERGRWDPLQLEIVLLNLLTNAIKYAPGAAVNVRVGSEQEQVVVSVEDRGPGIPAALRQRLFQRFSRLPTTSRVNGFGLGLWIARNFVEANGGTIDVDSEEGRGTTFVIRLPRSGPGASRPS